MAVTPRVVRGLRGSTAALDLDTEGGRAFLQQRVAFFNKIAFCISGTFFVVGAFAGPHGDPSPQLLHAATLVVSLAAWQLCGRGPSLSPGLLGTIDTAAVALVLVGFAAQALFVPPAFAGKVTRSVVLVLTHMVIVRAVVVPSTAARTAGVSLLAALPVVAALARLPPPPGADPVVTWNDRLWSGMWTACGVVVAVLVSHVIYGLRAEIQKARHLGQYTLEEKLGEGGMGSVYRARHAMLRRPTAIKLVPPEKASASALARFEREVQLTASLSHPNTVSVFDYGHTPDGHTRPDSPSERLGRPVPAGLERLVLACLEKEPAHRPGSAADLRDALGELDDVGSWGEREAREWWQRWDHRRGEQPREATARPARTLAIGLDRRSEEA